MQFFGVILLTLLLTLVSQAQEASSQSTRPSDKTINADVEKELQRILTSPYPYSTGTEPGFAQGYRPLFAKIGAAGVRQLQSHPNDGVALRAAWEEIRQTLPEADQDLPRSITPDAQKMNRFLGFLEGRLHEITPAWWEKAFLGAKAYRRENVFFHIPFESWPYGKYQRFEPSLSLSVPIGTNVEKRGDDLAIKIKDSSETIPSKTYNSNKLGPIDSFSASFGDRFWSLAVHSNRCLPYQLYQIERGTGKVVWESKVWAAGGGNYAGQGYHFVTIVAGPQRVLLFGLGDNAAYVEGFKAVDGTNLFRFSTAY